MGANALVPRLLHTGLTHVGPGCKGGRGAKKARWLNVGRVGDRWDIGRETGE